MPAPSRGVVLLDPEGDLIMDVLAHLTAEADDRLVLIDPAETDAQPPQRVGYPDTTASWWSTN
jgi:hypothetical protein